MVIVAFPFIIWGEDSLHGLGYFGIHYLLSSGRISHAIEAISQENDHKKGRYYGNDEKDSVCRLVGQTAWNFCFIVGQSKTISTVVAIAASVTGEAVSYA